MDLGLSRYSARTLAARPEAGPAIIAAAVMGSVVCLCVELICLVVAGTWALRMATCLFAGMILGNLQRMLSLSAFMLTAELNARSVLPGSILSRMGMVALVATAIWLRFSVLTVLLGVSLISLPVVVLRLWQLRAHFPARRDWRWSSVGSIVVKAWPFYSYSMTEIANGQLPIVCFALVRSGNEVGWLAAALVITGVFPQWTFSSADALLPVMTRLFEAQRIGDLLEIRERLLEVLLFLSVPVVVLLAVFAPQLCSLLGARFLPSASVLRLTSYCAGLAVIEGLLGGAFLTAIDCVRERRNIVARSVLLMVLLVLGLGHLWGARGAALGLIIVNATILLQYLRIFSEKHLPIRSWSATWSSLLAGAVMAGFSLYATPILGLKFAVPGSLLVYFGVLTVVSHRNLEGALRTLRECVIGA
jgi:O-antigen/teichoic acid export membrane protein